MPHGVTTDVRAANNDGYGETGPRTGQPMSTPEPRSRPSAPELQWAWQLVADRARDPDPPPAAVSNPRGDPQATVRATSMLIARLARHLAATRPPRDWASELLAWLLDDVHELVSPPHEPPLHGTPTATAVLTAAVLGHDMPHWLDTHLVVTGDELPAVTDVCWALAYLVDATHHRPGLADTTVADLLEPNQ